MRESEQCQIKKTLWFEVTGTKSRGKKDETHFKPMHPVREVGFTKFAALCLNKCVLTGAGGTYIMCTCTAHQNVKLMLEGQKSFQLTMQSDTHLSSCHHCLPIILLYKAASLVSSMYILVHQKGMRSLEIFLRKILLKPLLVVLDNIQINKGDYH
jgi:hypothetical protein